jgi:hypothetical protein
MVNDEERGGYVRRRSRREKRRKIRSRSTPHLRTNANQPVWLYHNYDRIDRPAARGSIVGLSCSSANRRRLSSCSSSSFLRECCCRRG